MRKIITLSLVLVHSFSFAQIFDYYGPAPFREVLKRNYNQSWSPSSVSSIENRKYVVLLDQATQSNAVMLNASDKSMTELYPIDSISGSNVTYGSMMRSIFQLVDENAHENNDDTPLSGRYKIKPLLHSYYALNASSGDELIGTDGGTYYIHEQTNAGYLLVEFAGTPVSTTIKAVSQWEYSAVQDTLVENTGWTDKWLMINGSDLSWTSTPGNATAFFLADVTDLIDIEIADGSDFNPLSETYQPNATAEIPEVDSMENNKLLNDIPMKVSSDYSDQLDNSATATAAASAMLNAIEADLIAAGDSLRYPKEFYLALRENMLSRTIESTDIYNVRLRYNNIEYVYFTNAKADDNTPHPFMVLATYASSERPNLLQDVNRPPGATPNAGYAESDVTRNGKIGEFLVKIPLKDYGLIDNLLDNDLTAYGDLVSDFDDKHSSSTTRDVYNYTSLVSCGMAIDGVTIYPAYNNNLRFAVEDAEVTSSGIHVGGGLELHYHADGHGFNGNGINLYNLPDYAGHDHPPVIGMSYDGIALFGKYEASHSSMTGYSVPLDEFGGHDHGDEYGYHYHAHSQNVTASTGALNFDEHFLMVGSWKGNINNIPAFLELKSDQLNNAAISRYAGVDYSVPTGVKEDVSETILIYPNPATDELLIKTERSFDITFYEMTGMAVKTVTVNGTTKLTISDLSPGVYIIKGENAQFEFCEKLVVK